MTSLSVPRQRTNAKEPHFIVLNKKVGTVHLHGGALFNGQVYKNLIYYPVKWRDKGDPDS